MRPGNNRGCDPFFVITSYSIHYTKLYEDLLGLGGGLGVVHAVDQGLVPLVEGVHPQADEVEHERLRDTAHQP